MTGRNGIGGLAGLTLSLAAALGCGSRTVRNVVKCLYPDGRIAACPDGGAEGHDSDAYDGGDANDAYDAHDARDTPIDQRIADILDRINIHDVYEGGDVADVPPDSTDASDGTDAGPSININNPRLPYGCDPRVDGHTLALYNFEPPSPLEDDCGNPSMRLFEPSGPTRDTDGLMGFGRARALDGTSYMATRNMPPITFPRPAPGEDASFTIEARVRPLAAPGGPGYIVAQNAGDGRNGFYVFLIPGGDGQLYLAAGKAADCVGDTGQYVFGTTPIPLFDWTHITFRYDGATHLLELLVNGALDASTLPDPRGVCEQSLAPLSIGADGNGSSPCPCAIDSLRISDIARDVRF